MTVIKKINLSWSHTLWNETSDSVNFIPIIQVEESIELRLEDYFLGTIVMPIKDQIKMDGINGF